MRRKSLLLLLALVVVGFLLMLSRSLRTLPPAEKTPIQEPRIVRPESASRAEPAQSAQLQMARQNARAELNAAIERTADPAYARYRLEQRRIDPQFDWKRPIEFYGKVIDENEKPVTGAHVEFVWNDLSRQGTSRADTSSDASGVFSLLGRTGKGISVTVAKDGYYTPPSELLISFEYANPFEANFHRPDPSNPVIFHLRKKGEAEPLIYGLKLFGARTDGTPSYIDLVEGKSKPAAPGDLSLRITRGERDANRKFHWSVIMEVPDGGLVESTNEFMFFAPEEGYNPKFEFSQQPGDPGWVSQIKRKFYLKTRAGRVYSRIEVTFLPSYNEMAAVDIQYFLNPSGSRNLEFDPAAQPKPKAFE